MHINFNNIAHPPQLPSSWPRDPQTWHRHPSWLQGQRHVGPWLLYLDTSEILRVHHLLKLQTRAYYAMRTKLTFSSGLCPGFRSCLLLSKYLLLGFLLNLLCGGGICFLLLFQNEVNHSRNGVSRDTCILSNVVFKLTYQQPWHEPLHAQPWSTSLGLRHHRFHILHAKRFEHQCQ